MRRVGSQLRRLRLPSEFRGRIWGAEHSGCRPAGRGVAVRPGPGPGPAPAYPPQADGLHPLRGPHVEDVHAILAVHRDVGGATTWRRCKAVNPGPASPTGTNRHTQDPGWHGAETPRPSRGSCSPRSCQPSGFRKGPSALEAEAKFPVVSGFWTNLYHLNQKLALSLGRQRLTPAVPARELVLLEWCVCGRGGGAHPGLPGHLRRGDFTFQTLASGPAPLKLKGTWPHCV